MSTTRTLGLRIFILFCTFLSFFIFSSRCPASTPSMQKKELGIAIIMDAEKEIEIVAGTINTLKEELESLLGSRYQISIQDADVIGCNWESTCIKNG